MQRSDAHKIIKNTSFKFISNNITQAGLQK